MAANSIAVDVGEGIELHAGGVAGLSIEDVFETRHGNSPVFYPIKMPGLGRVGDVRVADAVCSDAAAFARWYEAFREGRATPARVRVRLLAGDAELARWELGDLVAQSVTEPEVLADGAGVKVALIEFAQAGAPAS